MNKKQNSGFIQIPLLIAIVLGVLLLGGAFLFYPLTHQVEARSGCCSYHGGVCGCGCCDGTSLSATCAPYYPECGGGYSYPSTPNYGSGYSYPSTPSCPSMSSYDSLSGNCKCYSGYVVGKDFLGKESCISADQKCHDDYGYGASYSYLTKSCECNYGYTMSGSKCVDSDQLCRNQLGVFSSYDSSERVCKCDSGYAISNGQCVSLSSICTNQLGYGARYNNLSKKCECLSGYIISGGICADGNSTCRSQYGLYSSYNNLGNSCECDSGYVLDKSSQCVEKQNNVYFTLKELDTDEWKAIIKSDYDYKYYLITYNSGCYSSSFRRYLNQKIVVNLGTDFDLDRWDKIVLQDDDETCDVTSIERADSSTTLQPEEPILSYNPTPIIPQKPVNETPQPDVKPTTAPGQIDNLSNQSNASTTTITPSKTVRTTPIIKNQEAKMIITNKSGTTTPDKKIERENNTQQKQNFLSMVFSSIKSFFSRMFK